MKMHPSFHGKQMLQPRPANDWFLFGLIIALKKNWNVEKFGGIVKIKRS